MAILHCSFVLVMVMCRVSARSPVSCRDTDQLCYPDIGETGWYADLCDDEHSYVIKSCPYMCGLCGNEVYDNAALYFTFDEMIDRKIHARHGGLVTDIIPPGVYVDPIGRSAGALFINQSGCVFIGTFQGQCLSDPGQCTGGLTFSFFFNIQVTSPTTYDVTILTTGAHSPSRGVYFGYSPFNDSFVLKLKTSTRIYQTQIPAGEMDLSRTLLIPLTFTWLPSSDMKVYIRGKLWGSIAGVEGVETADTYRQFKIGCEEHGGEWSGRLKMDELAVWTRVLSNTEISKLSNTDPSHNDRSSSIKAAHQSPSYVHEQTTPTINVTKTTSLFTTLNTTLNVGRLDNNSIHDVTGVFSRLSSSTLEGTDCDDTVNLISTVSDIVNSLLKPDNHEAWEEFSETEPTALPSLVQAVDTVLEKITDHLLDSNSSINVHHVRDNFEITVKTGVKHEEILNLVPNTSMTLTSLMSPEVALVSNVFRGIGAIFPVEHNVTWSERYTESKIELGNHIVGVSVYPSDGSGGKRFNMTLPLAKSDNVIMIPKCVYLHLSSDQTEAHWSDRGCITDVSDDDVTCSCDHLTNFAILMQIVPVQLSPEDQHALGVVTFLGCTLSLLGAFLTVLTFLFLKIQTDRVLIHLNLAVSIIGSQILLLVEEAVQRGSTACAAVTVLLFYFNLSVFTWMLVEGVQLFLQIVIVFTAESRMKLFHAIGWGLPFILCGITAPIFHSSLGQYGVCWLSPLDNSIWAFVVPALLVIATNLVILVAVMRVILTLTVAMDDKRIRSVKTAVKSSILLLPLLGCTWLFGVMTVSARTMVFQYIFAVSSSFQGLFIFICHCVYSSEVRDVFLRRKSTWDVSRHLKTHSKVEPITNIRPSSFKARPEMKACPPERVVTPPTGSSLIGSVPESENSKPCCQNVNVD